MSIRLKREIRVATVVAMFIYISWLAYVCFFSERYGRIASDEYHYNLKPFYEISRFFIYRDIIGLQSFVINLFGNILVFAPWGFMVPVLRIHPRKFLYTACSTLVLSLCIETIQLMSRVGSFDVDDLILNTAGGILGCVAYFIINTVRRKTFGKADL